MSKIPNVVLRISSQPIVPTVVEKWHAYNTAQHNRPIKVAIRNIQQLYSQYNLTYKDAAHQLALENPILYESLVQNSNIGNTTPQPSTPPIDPNTPMSELYKLALDTSYLRDPNLTKLPPCSTKLPTEEDFQRLESLLKRLMRNSNPP